MLQCKTKLFGISEAYIHVQSNSPCVAESESIQLTGDDEIAGFNGNLLLYMNDWYLIECLSMQFNHKFIKTIPGSWN